MSEEKLLKVLLVEEDVPYAERCIKQLKNVGFEVHHVISYDKEFNRVFSEYKKEWAVIIMDASLDMVRTPTDDLIRNVREEAGDQTKMIANSASPEENQRLRNAGCNIRSTKGKFRSWGLMIVLVKEFGLEF